MKKLLSKIVLFTTVLLLLSFAGINAQDEVEDLTASGWAKKDYVTYFGTTDKDITVSWDAGSNAVSYEFKLYCVERKEEIDLGNTTALQIIFKLPKSGHYIARVRSVGSTGLTSDWAESIDPAHATVDGQPRAWWIYGHIAGPGPITIGKLTLGFNLGGGT